MYLNGKFYKISFSILRYSVVCLVFLISCHESSKKEEKSLTGKFINPEFTERPNILWIVAEDLSPYIPSFGDSTITTPHLSKLASEGVCYDNFYSPHPVCAPARAAIITGMYANAIGASHMRTGPWFGGRPSEETLLGYQAGMPEGISPYEAVPPPEVKMFTEFLRKSGYYCSNNSKEDYQFIKTPTAWDESSNRAHWRNRAPGQLFFSVFNIGITHESQIWRKKGDSLWVDKHLDVPVPPYLPHTEIARNDIRRMYSNIKEMDREVGRILGQLEADGLLENTVIFWYTDHGGPLPRQKRLLYDSGTRVPMIIRFPNRKFSGRRDQRMISFIDLAPTLLSVAEIPPPEYMQGSAFLGKFIRNHEPEYVYGAADRFDETTDRVRSARDNRFKYIRYYEPDKPMFLEVAYRNQMPIMQELLRLKKEGNLNEQQALWFRVRKPPEELFDLQNDPHELNNLAEDEAYKTILDTLRDACMTWTRDIHDTGLIEERDLLKRILSNGKQEETSSIELSMNDEKISLFCKTEGATIGYKILGANEDASALSWTIYEQPIILKPGELLVSEAYRIGFKPGAEQTWSYEDLH